MFKISQWEHENPAYYQQFGLPAHCGIDFPATNGTPVKAVKSGIATTVHTNPNTSNYGIHVRLLHENGHRTIYAHLQSVSVVVNQQVISGQTIGLSNNTGLSTGPHLHLELRKDNDPYTDPNGNVWPYGLRPVWPSLVNLYQSWLNQNSITGYLYSPGLIKNMSGDYARVYGTLNIRATPQSNGQLLGQVTSHTVVKILSGLTNGYYQVQTPIDIPVSGGNSNPAIALHLRADPDNPQSGEWSEVDVLKNSSSPRMIKLLHAHPQDAFRQAAQRLGTNAKYVIRIFQTGWDRVITPLDFYNWNIGELTNRVGILKNEFGIPASNICVEYHNEPNLNVESGNNWQDGVQFIAWCNSGLSLFKNNPVLNGVKWVYPGLSPGGSIPGVRRDSNLFLQESVAAGLGQFDYVGCHAYWSNPFPMPQAINHVIFTRNTTNKQIVLTEVSRNDRPAQVPFSQYGQEYAQFINQLKQQNNILGVVFFVGSASNPEFNSECWVTESNQVRGIAQSLVNSL